MQGDTAESAASKAENDNIETVPQIPQSSTAQNEFSEPSHSAGRPAESDTSNKRETEDDRATSKAEDHGTLSQSPVHQDENEALVPDQTSEADISDFTGSSDAPQSSNVTEQERIPCQYGKNCYR